MPAFDAQTQPDAVSKAETRGEMSRRHIAEAYLRIDRQEKRIARLISDNDLRSLPSANAVLRQMLWFLRNVEVFALTIDHEDRARP